jgi:ferredoxin
MTKIYYFSGTGNTLWSARRFAELIGDAELHDMGVAMRPLLERPAQPVAPIEADKVVFLFPAYALQMPVGVSRFMRAVTVKSAYIAACVTCGSHQGGALAEASRIMKAKGTPLSFAGTIPAVENYIPLFGYPRRAVIERKTPRHIAATEECARAIKAGRTNTVSSFHPLCWFVSMLFHCGRASMWKWYRVTDACTGCGACAKVCPVGAITMKNKRPVFSNKCQQCLACLSWCQNNALYTYCRWRKGVKGWTNPNIKIADMFRT